MAVERTIVLRGIRKGHHDEGTLDRALKPGGIVEMKANGHFDWISVTALESTKRRSIKVLKEDAYQGKTINDAYSSGDNGFIHTPVQGDHLLVLVKSGQTIAVEDMGVEEGGGSQLVIKAAGTETAYRFRFLEASSGALGADTLMKVEVL
jgi:hypothetical protein